MFGNIANVEKILKRVGASKAKDMESVGDSEAFSASIISIGAPLAT